MKQVPWYISGACFIIFVDREKGLSQVLTDPSICIIFKLRYLMLRFTEGG